MKGVAEVGLSLEKDCTRLEDSAGVEVSGEEDCRIIEDSTDVGVSGKEGDANRPGGDDAKNEASEDKPSTIEDLPLVVEVDAMVELERVDEALEAIEDIVAIKARFGLVNVLNL